MPMPARKIGIIATFFPESVFCVDLPIGVSMTTSSKGISRDTS